MSALANRKGAPKLNIETSPRASVTFPKDLYRSLEEIAKRKKVSVAWVVRDAAEKYVAEAAPSRERR
jgi:metal-responsive CopG/Arc/MetJ family transcriptional regulator